LNAKKNTSKLWLLGIPGALIFALLLVFLVQRFEGQPPTATLTLASPALGANQTLPLTVADAKSGLRKVWIGLLKDGQEIALLDKSFASAGMFSGGLIHEETLQVAFDPRAKGLKDGKAMLRISVRDYSWRQWFHGNLFYQEQEIIIDTQPPGVDVLSRAHYFSQGGAGIVIYKLTEQCPASGILVGEAFYPGRGGAFGDPSIHAAMVAVGFEQGPGTAMQVTATDFAGNTYRAGLQHLINARHFKQDTIEISDRFLDWKMPEFANQVTVAPGDSNLNIFLKVNDELRRANYEALKKATTLSDPQMHWKGAFLRLPNAAPRAGFADHRTYTYKGKKIDEQTHLGVDLASLEQSPVPAANDGKVVFAENLGIYGQTIIIDHGLGLFSMYSHLSIMSASPGQMVAKGDSIAKTGLTGLAAGDHLHFSMLVQNTFVNPVEWWDSQWIHNNIEAKIDGLQQ
jgi:murein DD-endopeptidase MepM/ murein hydrolase activator NlpD